MFYENEEEKRRVESIIDRLQDETFIPVKPGSCGKCITSATHEFKRKFQRESEDIITILALYLYAQGECSSAYNKFSFITEDSKKEHFCVIRNKEHLVFCTEKESLWFVNKDAATFMVAVFY